MRKEALPPAPAFRCCVRAPLAPPHRRTVQFVSFVRSFMFDFVVLLFGTHRHACTLHIFVATTWSGHCVTEGYAIIFESLLC